MGAEQSAVLACTQTGKPEAPLKLHNAERYFQLYFDQMKEPKTGPVTEALLHLILNKPAQQLEQERNCWSKLSDQDSGYENDESEELSDDEQVQKMDVITELSASEASIVSTSTEANQLSEDFIDFEFIPLEFVDLQPIEMDDPMLEFNREFEKRVADLGNEII